MLRTIAALVLLTTGCATAPSPHTGDLRRQLAPSWAAPEHGPVKVAFFDADDTLRAGGQNGPAATVTLLPNVASAVARAAHDGFLVAIASNQAGIEAGHTTFAAVDAGFAETVALIQAGGGEVHWVDYADAHDDNRKPNAGMARALEKALVARFGPSFTIDKSQSFMVGDDLKGADSGFAKSFGIRFISAAEFFAAERSAAPENFAPENFAPENDDD